MQTSPCGHRVVCRRCFVKTIQSAVAQRMLPLRCVICRARINRLISGSGTWRIQESASNYSVGTTRSWTVCSHLKFSLRFLSLPFQIHQHRDLNSIVNLIEIWTRNSMLLSIMRYMAIEIALLAMFNVIWFHWHTINSHSKHVTQLAIVDRCKLLFKSTRCPSFILHSCDHILTHIQTKKKKKKDYIK